MLRHPFRVLFRLLYFVGGCGFDWCRSLRAPKGEGEFPWRAEWLRTSSAAALARIGFGLPEIPAVPPVDLIVCNHLSYLDIPVISSRIASAFVSKAEVRKWPLMGAMATAGGTVYVRRERRGDVFSAAEAIHARAKAGVPVVIFPEGTSSGGAEVLPFHSSLLDPAAKGRWRVLPMAIAYEVEGGDASEEVCYWKDMTFFPHFLNLLSKRKVVVRIKVGEPVLAGSDRKALTEMLHRRVSQLHAELLGKAAELDSGAPRPGLARIETIG